MPVREFELFHGAVLTKLVRTDRPLTLRMIETKPTDAWSTYRVNDEISLVVKHSVVSRALKREKGARAWQFTFSRDQMAQIAKPSSWVACVCGAGALGKTEMEVCLLDPTQLGALLDLTASEQQALSVKRSPGKSLRAFSGRHDDELIIPRNRLDEWAVPGS